MPPRLRRMTGAAQTDSRLKIEEPSTVVAVAPAVTMKRRRVNRLLIAVPLRHFGNFGREHTSGKYPRQANSALSAAIVTEFYVEVRSGIRQLIFAAYNRQAHVYPDCAGVSIKPACFQSIRAAWDVHRADHPGLDRNLRRQSFSAAAD